jgi:hypothetical protein
MPSRKSALFVLLFLTLLVTPLAGGGLPAPQSPLSDFANARQWLKTALEFPTAYEKQFGGQFWQRPRLLTLYYDFLYDALGVRVFPQVLVGLDGWLYYTGEGNLDDYQCVRPFQPAELAHLRANLERLNDRLQVQGRSLLVVIAPNKERIYPEHLPPFIRRSDRPCRFDQVMQAMQDSPVAVLDPRPVLLNAKAAHQVYYRTDTHWNERGAFLVYHAMLERLAEHHPALQSWQAEQFTLQQETIRGDLSHLLLIDPPLTETAETWHPRQPYPAQFLPGQPDGWVVSEISGSALPRAVVFRDSFANNLIPFLSPHFSRAVYISSYLAIPHLVEMDIIEQEQADVVILEIAERYLGRLAEEPSEGW